MVKELLLNEIPRISIFENVISLKDCEKIVSRYTRSGMNPNSGYQSLNESAGQVTPLVEDRGISWEMNPYDYDLLATAIVRNCGIPFSHIEAIDIYNYETGQVLNLHHDYPYEPKLIEYYKYGGDRVGTVIFWFNDDYEGGECDFPKLNVTAYPKAGSMLYFQQCYSEDINWLTMHVASQITKGTKWIAAAFLSDQPRVLEK